MKEGFSNQELAVFRQLSREKVPPASLEADIIRELRSKQLMHKQNFSMKISLHNLVAFLIAAAIIIYYIYYSVSSMQSICENCSCEPIPGWDKITINNPVVLLGELHGTQEAPAFAAQMVCQASRSAHAVTLFLELSKEEQPAIDRYLASDGLATAKRRLLQTESWGRDYQDGRNSAAMFGLIEYIRKLKQEGQDVELVLIDLQSAPDRDLEMANNLLKRVGNDPTRFFIALMGNIHNQINPGSGRVGDLVLKALGSERVLSLNQLYGPGSAWVCLASEGCGVHKLGGLDGETRGIILNTNDPLGEYHGQYGVGPINASLPANGKGKE